MRHLLTLALAVAGMTAAIPASAQMPVRISAELNKFNVTIRRFDPAQGSSSGQEFVLPVDGAVKATWQGVLAPSFFPVWLPISRQTTPIPANDRAEAQH